MHQTLCIDIGNSSIKYGLFADDHIQSQGIASDVNEILDAHPHVEVAISSVKHFSEEIQTKLRSRAALVLSSNVDLPINISYKTPATLGPDRLAGVLGGRYYFPNQNVLTIDCGTCITIDLCSADDDYHGGVIVPGLRMRLRAMHEFTNKLPLAEPLLTEKMLGNSTLTSLQAGAYYGCVNEIDQWIYRLSKQFKPLKVILTGGDASNFGKHLENSIFAAPNLVLEGLNLAAKYQR